MITGYLLVYFFIYDGCEELIKFWVLGNLIISIAFTVLRMGYVFVSEGKEGLKKAITKERKNFDKSSSIFADKQSFKLNEDFYSIAFYSYIAM